MHELIDTLWNVNKSLQTIANQAQQRINRYIMECKYICITVSNNR